ncbi:hypothetical protein [Methylobacterium nodulans]|uniref:Uncharacterized protein n=1 Tax=Methylobacterium nodulans (strain LMG 21967 / CNCM I-2342 / ORS 2060) TaxID=460265 RepID=B8ITR8_METNO|nr:hypothetical protein [Methylobacterium nodulans]ACL58984.1 hypothetical protein Mnod_4105 [Methylobacterium nodulans ORS 2060]
MAQTAVITPADPFAWHAAALRNEAWPLEPGRAPCGFFRLQRRDGSFEPVAVWPEEDGVLWAKIGEKAPQCLAGHAEEEFCERVIARCWRSPIPEPLYWAVCEGAPWPDLPPTAPADYANLPGDAFEALRIEIESERDEIERWLKDDPIQDQTACDRAANWASRLADLEKKAGSLRVEEKRAHDEAAKAVQAKWKPLEDLAASLKRRLKEAQLPFQQEQRRREAEARAAAAQAGEAVRLAKATGAGTVGRRSSLRTTYRAEIEDFDAALAALRDNPELRQLVQRLADKVARTGATLPGTRSVPIQSVA